jgi:hypothetical protein
MTNILATISLVVVTNWIHGYTMRPPCPHAGCPVFHTEVRQEIGAVVTNATATIVWQDRTNQFVLHSTEPFYSLQRSVTNNVDISPSPVPQNYFTLPAFPPGGWMTNIIIR